MYSFQKGIDPAEIQTNHSVMTLPWPDTPSIMLELDQRQEDLALMQYAKSVRALVYQSIEAKRNVRLILKMAMMLARLVKLPAVWTLRSAFGSMMRRAFNDSRPLQAHIWEKTRY